MGTNAHVPTHDKTLDAPYHATEDDEAPHFEGGARPGVRSRMAEARDRLKKAGKL